MSSARIIKGDVAIKPYGMPALKNDFLEAKRRKELEAEAPDPEEVKRAEKIRLDALEKDARQRGYDDGILKGRQEMETKTLALIDQLNAAAGEVKVFRRQQIEELEPAVVALAISMARKILINEISMDPQKLVRIVKEALLRLDKTGPITIKINPAIYDIFQKHKHDLLEAHNELVMESDPLAAKNGPVLSGAHQEAVTDVSELFDNLMEDMGENLVRS